MKFHPPMTMRITGEKISPPRDTAKGRARTPEPTHTLARDAAAVNAPHPLVVMSEVILREAHKLIV